MKSTASLYNDYSTAMQQIADVKYASAVLQWDQETYLPAQGSHFRGQQIATLTAIAHERFTSKSLEDILLELSARSELGPEQARNAVSYTHLDVYKRQTPSCNPLSNSPHLAAHRANLVSAQPTNWPKVLF